MTDPGLLCTGQPVTLTCDIAGGTDLTWNYIFGGTTERIANIIPLLGTFPPPDPIDVSGIEFMVTVQMPTIPDLVSNISFVANPVMNGRMLQCSGATATGQVDSSITLEVASSSELYS